MGRMVRIKSGTRFSGFYPVYPVDPGYPVEFLNSLEIVSYALLRKNLKQDEQDKENG